MEESSLITKAPGFHLHSASRTAPQHEYEEETWQMFTLGWASRSTKISSKKHKGRRLHLGSGIIDEPHVVIARSPAFCRSAFRVETCAQSLQQDHRVCVSYIS